VGTIVTQGGSDSIGCRTVVDGVVKAETISHEVEGLTFCTFCLLKAA
jgi:Mycobacterium membrane protein